MLERSLSWEAKSTIRDAGCMAQDKTVYRIMHRVSCIMHYFGEGAV
jgi:hypothetical protein